MNDGCCLADTVLSVSGTSQEEGGTVCDAVAFLRMVNLQWHGNPPTGNINRL